MKLLFDENLSRKLVVRLAELYPESAHLVEVGLLASPDRDVWEYAKTKEFVVVSTDSDFYGLATTIGPPPKVVWLRRWTHPTRDAEQVLRREAVRITEFVADPEPVSWCSTATDNLSQTSSTGAGRFLQSVGHSHDAVPTLSARTINLLGAGPTK